jgi:chromosome segregation ATPase
VREQLTNAQQYAGRLEVLLRERSERIDELNAKLEQLRAANEKLAEMVRLPSGPPSLDAA